MMSPIDHEPFRMMGDPLADAAMADLWGMSPPERERLLSRVLEGKAGACPESLTRLLEQVSLVPEWVDWGRMRIASRAFLRAGAVGLFSLGCCSTPFFYSLANGNKALAHSGHLRTRAPRRGRETSRFVIETFMPDSLHRQADGFKMTVRVRLMHAWARRHILESGTWNANLGTPINQIYMAAMSALLSAKWMDALERLGFRLNREETEGIMVLWRYSAYLIGVDPRLQFADKVSADAFLDEVFRKEPPPDDDSLELVQALLEAIPEVFGASEFWKEQIYGFSEGLTLSLLGEPLATHLRLRRTFWRHSWRILRVVLPVWNGLEKLFPVVEDYARYNATRLWLAMAEFPVEGGLEMFSNAERMIEED